MARKATRFPSWYRPTIHSEHQRLANSLYVRKDGWYIREAGRTKYLCKPMPIDDALHVLDDRIAGVVPLTVADAVGHMLADVQRRVAAGTLKPTTARDYTPTLAEFAVVVGEKTLMSHLGPQHFDDYLAAISRLGPNRRRSQMQYVTAWLNRIGPGDGKLNLIAEVPNKGPNWVKPSPVARDRSYTDHEVRVAYHATRGDAVARACFYLGLFCGLTHGDIAAMTPDQFASDGAVVFAAGRRKTGQPRRGYLPPRLAVVVARALPVPMARDALTHRYRRVTGLQQSALRSTLATWLDDFPDQNVVDVLMGHAPTSVRRSRYSVRPLATSRLAAANAVLRVRFRAALSTPTAVV